MGLKKVKLENKNLDLSLIDMLQYYDISKTKKYTQFLVKMFKELIQNDLHLTQQYRKNGLDNDEKMDTLVDRNSFEGFLTHKLVVEILIGYPKIKLYITFCELMERGLVEIKDISTYDSWEMVENQVFLALNKANVKKAKKEIKIIYEDSCYLVFKPLTYLASCTYGYQTKWCTSMINSPDYFYDHSSKGVLIYVINKNTNEKYGFFYEIMGLLDVFDVNKHRYLFKVFDNEDRQVDTFQTNIPHNILSLIYTDIQNSPENWKFFSKVELKQMAKHVSIPSVDQPVTIPLNIQFEEPGSTPLF